MTAKENNFVQVEYLNSGSILVLVVLLSAIMLLRTCSFPSLEAKLSTDPHICGECGHRGSFQSCRKHLS